MSEVLADICYIRSGDKGNTCTVGLIAKDPIHYEAIKMTVTPEKVAVLYGNWVKGKITCYQMDNIHALVVVMEGALGGGATKTLRLDQTGKSLGYALLRLPVQRKGQSSKKTD